MVRRMRDRKKDAIAAEQCFANAGFVHAPIRAGNDAGREEKLDESQVAAKASGPEP